ncbi:MAG: rod shape-determining protein MreD [Myxococcota bacterium]
MLRNSAFLLLGLGLIVVQSNLFRVVGWLRLVGEEVAATTALAGLTPSLLLPMVVFMGVREYSLTRGAGLSFALGYLLDVFAAAPVGLYTFTSVAVFVVGRLAGVRLAAQTLPARIALAFVFSLLEGFFIVVLTAIFGTDSARPRALASLVLPHAVTTALFAPVVLALAARVHAATVIVPRPGEVPTR